MSTDAATPAPKLTAKQQRFVEEYCVDWNCTQAAIRAGYAKKNAGQEGHCLYKNVEIKAAIEARLNDLSLSAGQVTKSISDIAQTSINEFIVVNKVEKKTKIQQPLAETIRLLEAEIAFDEEYAVRSADVLRLLDKQREAYLEGRQEKIDTKRLLMLEYQMQLERDPEATITIAGPPELVDRAEFDLVKLAQAKANNRIKSWQPSEFGIKVEMYDASAALRDMGRVRGIFEKDNSQAGAVAVINTKVEIVRTGPPIARSEKDIDDV